MEWLQRQWNDIKGNVKFWILSFVVVATMTGAVAITHGLALWQQVVIMLMFTVLLVWSVAATASLAALESHGVHSSLPVDPLIEQGIQEEFDSLTLAEKVALRGYLHNRRATNEQIWRAIEAVIGVPPPHVDMWDVLNKKTRFMDRDYVGTNGIKPEFQPMIASLLKNPWVP